MKENNKKNKQQNLQQQIFVPFLIIIVILTLVLSVAGVIISISSERKQRDKNLLNIAESVAHSQVLSSDQDVGREIVVAYMDSLEDSLNSIDVISVIGPTGKRIYHTNQALIGTIYDGNTPDFSAGGKKSYIENSVGPSGNQRRAYAAIYSNSGEYKGFVLAVCLMHNIYRDTFRTLYIYIGVAIGVIVLSLVASRFISKKIKANLMGYEPDTFSMMYKLRDNILVALDEGVIAVDRNGVLQFANAVACRLLNKKIEDIIGNSLDKFISNQSMIDAILSEKRQANLQGFFDEGVDVLMDVIPINDGETITGTVAILHDRTEYTKLMEDLTGTKFLVDSIRANNHDFTNKLHVIMGLLQMEMYDQAVAYVENISMVQRETISNIMNCIKEPSVAALLVGKSARAAELNSKFILQEDSYFNGADIRIPSGTLVTIIGNLIDNALEAMDGMNCDYDYQRELRIGIYSKKDSLLIAVEDNGPGIPKAIQEKIFLNGYSTKGEGRGTGLFQIKQMIEGIGGRIDLKSVEGKGSSFTVIIEK